MIHAEGAINNGASALLNGHRGDMPFTDSVKHTYKIVAQREKMAGHALTLDGSSLALSDVELVIRFGVLVQRSSEPRVENAVEASVDLLARHLARGDQVYGVNTGFGGSADVRTKDLQGLQQGLLQMQNSGVLTSADVGRPLLHSSLMDMKSHALPRGVVKAAMVTRCNSLLRGHSAVRLEVIDKLLALINADLVPIVPLRGSISASGDLSPLSYIAGALEGNPDIYIQAGEAHSFAVTNAQVALLALGLDPVVLGPKEGLGLLNGTAVSTAAAAIVHTNVERLVVLSHHLTAMATECLRGSPENFSPFISAIRPHAGQIESAALIFRALETSRLSCAGEHKARGGLAQDRYATRTASQWLGPQLEDLGLARRQIDVELNSTTDNPLIDVAEDKIHHGGNFQAASITSAMEKTRLAVQMVGKLLFAQTSEIVNPSLNGVLSPNLIFDEPSTSFGFKGVDINMAAYMSELAFLANPVSSHVQSAELHNQSVNSLALISARYASDAVDVLYLMAATHLYITCQALDLQVHHMLFEEAVREAGRYSCSVFLSKIADEPSRSRVLDDLLDEWVRSKTCNLHDRANKSVQFAMNRFIADVFLQCKGERLDYPCITGCTQDLVRIVEEAFSSTRFKIFDSDRGALTASHLGRGTRPLYLFVRRTLEVSTFKGLVEHPTHPAQLNGIFSPRQSTIGSQISKIYEAIRAGSLWDSLLL